MAKKQYGLGHTRLTVPGRPDLTNKTAVVMVGDKTLEEALEECDGEIFDEYIDATDQQRNTALANVSNQTANSTSGKMGYKVLDPTKTFAEQVTAENTIYEIRDVFDLNNGSVTIPANCTLKFNGGKILNGDITVDETNTIVSSSKQIFSSIKIHGNVSNSDNVRTSWFGGLAPTLASIQDLNVTYYPIPLNVFVDKQESVSETIAIKRGKMNLIFLKKFTTTINNGTPILDIDTTTASNVADLSIIDFKVNAPYPDTQTIQNCIGIKFTGGNSDVRIVRPMIYYVKTGILFAATSSYLSRVEDATLIHCETGLYVKKRTSNWQNGLYFSFKDLSRNNIGFLAEHGGRNTLEFKNSEVGSNDIGIKISGGTYELIGTQWNENAVTSALVVENDGVVRLTGNSGINNIDKVIVGNEAVLYEDKGQEFYPIRDVVDQRTLSFAIAFKNGIVRDILSGANLPIVRGETARIGDIGESYCYNLSSGNYIHDGYIELTRSLYLKDGVSVIAKAFSNTTSSGAGYNLELTNDITIGASNPNRYRLIFVMKKTYYNIAWYKGSTKITSLSGSRAPIVRLNKYTYGIKFDHNLAKDIFYNKEVSYDTVSSEDVDTFKNMEFKYLRIEGAAVSNTADVMFLNSALVFNSMVNTSEMRYLAENNVEIISEVKTTGATTDRPNAAVVGVGFQFFDTTLGKPIYSTGTAWVDATGTVV